MCHLEPLVTIKEAGKTPFIYGKVTPENAKKIVVQHVINGQPVSEWLVNLKN
jgi:NADP-reducing hydrogenase subunit HndB